MSKSDNRQRHKVVAFRLEPEDFDRLANVAAPLSPGQFARRVAMEAAGLAPARPGRRPLPKVADVELLRAVLAEMGHWGGNLNQVAHRTNMGQPTVAADVARLRAELEPIKRRLLIALGVLDP